MEPPGIPDETLEKAKRMRAKLLIQTNKMQIIKHVKLCHNINLNLNTSVASTQSIHVCLHLQHAITSDVSNTVKCVDPNTDILEQLNMYIHEEVEQLYDYIQHTSANQQVVCYLCGQTAHCT